MGDSDVMEKWSTQEARLHMKCLEFKIKAIPIAEHQLKTLQSHQVLVATDNTTVPVLSYWRGCVQ